jgi:hypothetical protein
MSEQKLVSALTFALVIIFCVSALVYAWFSIFRKTGNRGRKDILFNGGFALCTALLGVSFVTHYPYNRYNFLHCMIYIWCAYLGFVLTRYCGSERQSRGGPDNSGGQKTKFPGTFLFFSLFYLFFILLKLFTFTDRNFYLRLPLNVCNIALVIIMLRFFFKNDMLDNYALTLGFLGAVMNFFMGAWHNDSYNPFVLIPGKLGFYYPQVIEATLVHSFFLSFCIYAFLTENIVPNPKAMAKNFIWIVPLFAVFVFTNQIYEGDYFFTGTLRDTPPLLLAIYNAMPFTFDVKIGGRLFEINILHNLIVIMLSFAVMLTVNLLLLKIHRVIHSSQVTRAD